MLNCGKIYGNIAYNCDKLLTTGTVTMYVGNYIEVADVTLDTDRVITSLTVGCLYKIEGRQNSIQPIYSLIKGNFTEMYDHTVKALGFDISPDVKKNLEGMKSGLFIVIVENVNKGNDGKIAFEVYGINAGLVMTMLQRDPSNADTQGAFDFTFTTNKNKEPFMPLYLQVGGSYTATKEFLENALCSGELGDFNNDFNNDFNI